MKTGPLCHCVSAFPSAGQLKKRNADHYLFGGAILLENTYLGSGNTADLGNILINGAVRAELVMKGGATSTWN